MTTVVVESQLDFHRADEQRRGSSPPVDPATHNPMLSRKSSTFAAVPDSVATTTTGTMGGRAASTSSLRRSPSGSAGGTSARRATTAGTSSSQGVFSALLRQMNNNNNNSAAPNNKNNDTAGGTDAAMLSGSPQRSTLFRLIGTTSTRAAKNIVRHATTVGEEQVARRLLQREEASARYAIAASLYSAAAYQHALLAANPNRIPSTNIIEGVPLLASLYVPHGGDGEGEQRMEQRRVGQAGKYLKAHSSTALGVNKRGPTITTTDGFVVIKNTAYSAVRDTTPSMLSSNASVHSAAAAATPGGGPAAVHRDPTSPPSHTPMRYPYNNNGSLHGGAAARHNNIADLNNEQTFSAVRQFDKVVRAQQETARATYSEVSLAWMPHEEIGFLFKQWNEFFMKWARRAGATPSSLLSSFLCTMLIDDDAEEERAEFLNKVVMEETLEIVCDADAVHTPSSSSWAAPQLFGGGLFLLTNLPAKSQPQPPPPVAPAPVPVTLAISYNEFCYVLRNVGEAVFPVRDPVAAIRLLTTSLMDRYHRVHY
uniref:Uncharacterized protein n=1 Tax=Bodo saltans TaxID=75058 RepID=B6DT74_BODSA|nr:hypothetical protein [Bodo saltans]